MDAKFWTNLLNEGDMFSDIKINRYYCVKYGSIENKII